MCREFFGAPCSRELAEAVMRMVWSILVVLAVAYAGLLIVVFLFQSRLVYFPNIGRELSATPPSKYALFRLAFKLRHPSSMVANARSLSPV